MIKANQNSLKVDLTTFQMQLASFLPSVISDQLSTLGRDGVSFLTDSIDTLKQWYDTLSPKEKMIFWTLIVDFLTLDTPLGTPSRGVNSG
jgi:hypothetical protein